MSTITIIASPGHIIFAQLLARKSALALEIRGMRHSSGMSTAAVCKRAYAHLSPALHLIRRKHVVLAELDAIRDKVYAASYICRFAQEIAR